MNRIEFSTQFSKDLKKLMKRFPSLKSDLETFIKFQLIAYHKHQVDNRGTFLINRLKFSYPKIFKVKKFACKSLKGKGVHSGIRVIYAYFPDIDRIEFIELYYKGDREVEDRDRIKKYFCS